MLRHKPAMFLLALLTVIGLTVSTAPPGSARGARHATPAELVASALAHRPDGMSAAEWKAEFTRFVHRIAYKRALDYMAALARQARERAAAAAAARAGDEWRRWPWAPLAACESTSRWHLNIGSFDGGLQFSPRTWTAFGGGRYAPYAWQATEQQQVNIAKKVLASQGWRAWPVCSHKLHLR